MEFTETFPVIVKPRRPIIGFTSMDILKKRVEEICAKILTVDIKTKSWKHKCPLVGIYIGKLLYDEKPYSS